MKNHAFLYVIILLGITSFYGCSDDTKENNIDTKNGIEVSVNEPSTMPCSGIAKIPHSAAQNSADVANLFSLNKQTSFTCHNKKTQIVWQSSESFIPESYFLISSPDNAEKDPKSCILYASIDGVSWKALDVISNIQFSARSETKEITLGSDFSYQYYKLELIAQESSSSIQLSKWGITTKDNGDDEDDPISVRITEESTMPSSGIITIQYSDSPEGYGIENLVDRDLNTSFASGHKKARIEWRNDYPFVANTYFITSSKDNDNNTSFEWSLSVSTDGKTWLKVDEQENQTFSTSNQRKEYSFDNSNLDGYTHFRLVLSTSDQSGLKLSQWGISGTYDDSYIVKTKGKRFKHSDKTPMGIIYEKCRITTQSDLDWLADPNNEPELIEGLNATWKEWSVNLYPFGKPLPSDINQHSIGDCSGIAALAALAYAHPEFIKSIIKTEENGTVFCVSMYDPQGKPITVKLSNKFLVNNDGSIAQVTSKKPLACWSTILEKAVMKYNTRFEMEKLGQHYIGGIGSDAVFTLFSGTGDSYAFDEGSLTPQEMKTVVLASLSRGDCVSGFYTKAIKFNGTEAVLGHGFTVTLSPTVNDLFVMRNPWGNNPNQPRFDGLCNIPKDGEITPTIILCVLKRGEIPFRGTFNPYTPPAF